ncbi:MAG: DUF3244 domain-containing protein [Bacteroidota bacterium]
MRISKSMLSKTCVIAGLLLVSQFSFATDIIIRKDDQSPPPQPMPNRTSVDSDIALTATVDNSNLAVYFNCAVGEATIIVYDENQNVVYQTVAETDSILNFFIPLDCWSTGDYTITISYGTINLIGDFQL